MASTEAKGKQRATDDAAAATAQHQQPDSTNPNSNPNPNEAVAAATGVIIIGMAGSGKTTFMQRVNAHLHAQRQTPYILNLDPAVTHLPFTANIDIRDTVDYQQVMKQYNLGPNGGILTALNLFTTKFDQVLQLVDKRSQSVEYVAPHQATESKKTHDHCTHSYVFLDTPGQIEIFTWSASGAIITDAMASALPTCVAYIIDTPRTTNPATFMSNMLYACSILYKTRLPFILVFNKTDVEPHDFAIEWMRDFETFQQALYEKKQNSGGEDGPGYMDSLMNSMSLVLDEFYKHLRAVGVSAMTGEGMQDFFDAVNQARQEYLTDYKPELDKLVEQRKREKEQQKADSVTRLMKDMSVSGDGKATVNKTQLEAMLERDDEQDEQDSDDDDDDGEVIDKSSRTDYYELPTKRPTRGTPAGVVADDGTLWPAP
ncbi:hypothetical protein OIO90_000930 [Microbotryomycetes sp. JL221]|nr:hypothetical protein OIO90_000930 [Microbotryomycetes sp. JL221]